MQFIKRSVVLITACILSSSAALSWAEDASVVPNSNVEIKQSPQDLNLPFKGLNNYSQSFSDWGVLLDPKYDQPIPIKNPQMQDTVRQHYFGENSVWEARTGEQLVKKIQIILNYERSYITVGGGYNDPRPENQSDNTKYTLDKRNALEAYMNLDQQQIDYKYDSARRGIIIQNANTRILPTMEGYYYDGKLPGEGPDSDHIQTTATWAGTPVYILAYTIDGAWALIYTSDCIGWIEKDKVATVDPEFIKNWKQSVDDNGLVAVINSEIPITDKENAKQQFKGYVGMILPLAKKEENNSDTMTAMIPVDNGSGAALIHYANLSKDDAVKVPFLPTPRHFVTIMQHQLGRHFAWGAGRPYGTSSDIFYNDASSEMKNLFVAFGIYLPRHSTDQVNPSEVPGKAENYADLLDASGNKIRTKTVEERIDYLKNNGHPFMTIIGGLGLYLGNYVNPADQTKAKATEALVYYNPFGLRPGNSTDDRRAVIEKAVILPLLASYPDSAFSKDNALVSLANQNPSMQVMYLDDVVNDNIDQAAVKNTATQQSVAAPTSLMVLPNKPVDIRLDIKGLMAR